MKLSESRISKFKNTGFLFVPGLYCGDELEQLINWIDEVTQYPEVPGKYMMYFEQSQIEPNQRLLSRMEDVEPYHQGFSDLFTKGAIQQITSQLFGDEAVLFKDKINFKMPGGDGFRAHQDVQAGWDRYAKLHITALVSIDPSTKDNGCLEMASGHHDKGLIGEQWKPLAENKLDYMAVPTEPGDAVFFDSYAPHRSGPNLSGEQRRVLYVTYNAHSEGDHRRQYYDDKRLSYPPDIEREPDKQYVFRV